MFLQFVYTILVCRQISICLLLVVKKYAKLKPLRFFFLSEYFIAETAVEILNESGHSIIYKTACAHSEDSDHLVHFRSLIRPYVGKKTTTTKKQKTKKKKKNKKKNKKTDTLFTALYLGNPRSKAVKRKEWRPIF